MKAFINKITKFFMEKKIKIADIVFFALLIFCIIFILKEKYKYDIALDDNITLSNAWMVKTDKAGNNYVIDSECSRIVKIDTNNEVNMIINGYAPDGDTFYYADSVAVAEDGSIYVLDVGWSETGFSLACESILKYDKDGKFQSVVYFADYSEVYCDKHRIFGMRAIENNLYFVSADDEGFKLNCISDEGEDALVEKSVEYADAITLIQDFAIDDSKNIYGVCKTGTVFVCNDKSIKNIYAKEKSSKETLYRMGVGDDGIVYVTDIADDLIISIDSKSGDNEITLEGDKQWNVSVVKTEDGKYRISSAGYAGITVVDEDGNEVISGDNFKKGNDYLLRELLFDLSLVVILVSGIFIALRLIGVLFAIKYTNSQKIGMIIAFTVSIVTVIIVSELIGQFKDMYRDELLNKLSMTAQIVSNTMDVDALVNVENPEDYMNKDYKNLIESMNTTLDKNYDYSEDMYCNIMKYNGEEAYVVAYLDNSIGAYYPLSDEEQADVIGIYDTGETVQSDVTSETGSYIYVEVPVYDSENQVVGVVAVGTLSSVLTSKIDGMVKRIIISLIMIVLIILFLFSEVFSFIDLKNEYKQNMLNKKKAVPLHIVRIVVFVTFMAFNMATSFLPVYVSKFVAESIGIPTELAASIPMSVNLIFIGLTSVVCARLMKKFGFRNIAAASALIAMCGDLMMAFASSYWMIIVGLILNGIGVGIITNSIHMFIAASDDGDGKEEGYAFSIFNAASLSGINCGMMFGAALAEALGQSKVFIISSVAWAFVIAVFVVVGKSIKIENKVENKNNKKTGLLKYFFSKSIIGFIICVQVPYIVINSFTYYYVPIFGDANGLGENETCLLIMISSLCSVYLSVPLTKYLSAKIKSNTIYLSSAICFLALFIFAFRMSLPSLIIALIMIGIANSFGTSERITYFISSKKSQDYGEDKAMGVYNLVDNIGESAGPVVFANILSAGMLLGTGQLVLISAGLNLIYAMGSLIGKDKKKKK